ncbi:hypothetical protein B0H14DRAFT_2906638 [Mycena olivaceomarginata]|nr:hypothetical protein B0H14DRAFT_2906638 [Mycena olivaceomarginata]
MLESRRRLKLNTWRCSTAPVPLPSLQLPNCSCAFRSQHARCNTPHVEHVWPPLGPALRLSLLLLPSFPSVASTFSAPSPFLVSLLPPHPTARCQPTAEPHRFTNVGWCYSCAALLCGSGSASKMPSVHCQLCVPTAPPILPSRPVLLDSGRLRQLATSPYDRAC